MTDNKFIDAFKRMLTMALALIMVLGSVVPIATQEASAFDGKKGSKYTVYDGGQIVYGSGSGGYSNSRKCDLGDDLGSRYSYCVQPAKLSPGTGTVTVDKVVTDDNDTGKWNALRNIVYYSPSYPGYDKNITNIKSKYYTGDFSKDWGIAHLALSYVYDGRPSDMATFGGTHASDLGEVWTKAKKLGDELYKADSERDAAVPASFKVFICYMSGVQDMIVGYLEAPGHLNMKKVSNRTSITDGNNCYSLDGAEYTVYDSNGKAVEYLYTNAKGESNTVDLMEGTYTVKETYAPPGYAKDTETYTVKIVSEKTTTFTAKEEPITDLVQLLLTKNPVGYPRDHGEGDATLKGAVYKFEYYDRLKNQEVLLKAAKADAPLRTWHFVTDEHGKIDGQNPTFASGYSNDSLYKDKDGKVCYPLGTYLIQEVKAPEGYLVNDEILEVTVTEDGTDNIHVKTYNEAIKGNDTIKRGGVKVAKIDNDLDTNYAQGDATLAGAEFTIYNQSKETVMVGGKEIAKGGAALVITTNADGIATSDAHALPYGSYLVKETKPSKGYLLNTEWSRAFTIREDGKIVDLTEDKVREAVIRGGVQIIKRDKELVKSEALGGARLDDIVMTIKNVSGRDVVVRNDLNNKTDKVDWKKLESKKDLFDSESIKRVPSGKDVGKITVHWNEEKKAYTAETLADDLPYGTYTIRESKTNETYQRTDKTEHMFTIREDGVIVSFDDNKNEMALTFDDYVYRSDVQGTKIADSTSERFSFVPFKIISVTNGETHVVVTDKNGFFSTKDRRSAGDIDEDEDADTARKQNPFDDLLEAKEIKTADLEKRSQDILHGVWFGTGEFGDKAPMKSKFGALPYDSYILEEMPCEHNEGYILQKFYFTVDQKSQNGFVDLETITDDVPEIGTTASVDGKNKNIRPQKEIKLVDVIEYKNLKKGETYTAKGVLMDKATKAPVLDMNGKQITAEQEFKTFMSSGKVKVTFTFDATSLYGKDTVVFEKVFDSEGHVAAKHEEIDDEGQTVTWEKLNPKYEMYKIRTTKAPSAGDKYGFFAQDEVEYEVHVENTGNIEITMDVTDQFTQNPEYFTEPMLKDVKFTGNGTWNNKADFVKDEKTAADQKKDVKQIANITLNVGEKATVTYTAVVKDEAKAYLAANAKDSDSLDEKNHDTNMAYQKNKTDDKDGYWNTAECVNVTYPNPEKPEEPGKLEPKKDVAQTPVQKPAIGTSLANGKGDKTVAAAKDTQLIDTIAYVGLDTSKWYVFEGTLMVKDSGDPVVTDAEGNDVTAEFSVNLVPGALEITRRPVLLTSADAEKQYDGKALTNNEVTIGGRGFAEGEGVVCETTGRRILPGTSENTFTYSAAGGTDLNNYEITSKFGRLLVRDRDAKYEITLTAPGQTVMYDGNEHGYDSFTSTEFEVEGGKYTVEGISVACSGTDAGVYKADAKGAAVIKDEEGNDVTAQFTVNVDAGDLTIQPRKVILRSGTSSREYDGTALTNETVTVEGDGFTGGDGVSFKVSGSRKTVGTSENSFTYELNEGTKAGNYSISTIPGSLTVISRDAKYSIKVAAKSGSAKYDGKEHSVEGLESTTFDVGGNIYTVSGLKASGTGVHAGSYPVAVTGKAVVKDAEGNDVTDEFAVDTENGELTITKRNVVLTSADAEKTYDGTALINGDVTVGGDGFAEGEGASYEVTGTRTVAGFAANLFRFILNGNTNADDYSITVVPGKLSIVGRGENDRYEVGVRANSGSFVYDGSEHTVSGLAGEKDGVLSVSVGGNNYTISGLSASASLTDAGEAVVSVEGTPKVTDAEGNDVTSEFRIKAESGSLSVRPREVILSSASASKAYDGQALTNEEVTAGGEGFIDGEGANYSVSGSQRLVGTSNNSFSYSLKPGTKASNYSISVQPGTLTVTNRDAKYEILAEAKSGEFKYSGEAKTVEGLKAESFEVEGNTYTVSGLTAKAEATDAGTYAVNVTGTAKVEDASGNDVTEQFAVNTKSGSLNIGKRYVVLTSENGNKQYDGKALKAGKVKESRDGFAAGEGAEYKVSGSQTLVGSSENSFTYTLKEGTKAENYTIEVKPGTLTVSDREAKQEITLTPKSETVTYDGEKHVAEGFEETEFTFDGVTYKVTGITARAAGMNAGYHEAVVEGGAVILDADGNDVTTQFITRVAPGGVTINKRNVVLTSGTESKEYDGKALKNEDVSVSGDGFAEGEGATYNVTGRQKKVGSSANAFTYELSDGTSADNYSIQTVPGTLTVTNRGAKYSIEIEANSGSFMYDGAEKTVEGFRTESFEIDGSTYTVSGLTAEGRGTDASVYAVNVSGTAVVTDEAGDDVSDQFAVEVKSGSLEITKRALEFTSADGEKEYDGTALTNDKVNVTGDGFADGEGAEFTVSGSRTLAGESDNTFTYELNDGTKAENYDISVKTGKLTVTDRSKKFEIELKPVSDAALYDGSEHSVEGFENTEFSFGGVTYTVSGLTASAAGTDAGTYPVNVTGNASVTDASGNDVTDQFDVRIMPAQLRIDPRTVKLTSASASAEYTGDELRNDEVTASGDGFAEGEGASYSFTGGQTVVGISENSFEYTLNEGTKAGNYIIEAAYGTLNVRSRETAYGITVKAVSGSFLYDGSEKSVEGLESSSFNIEGKLYTVSGLSASASAVHAGSYPVNITGTAVVTDENGNDVSDQFSIETVSGDLTIRQRTVTMTSGSAEKSYDGEELKAEEIAVSGDGFAEGEGAEYTYAGSRLIPGSSENTFTYELNEGTTAADYNIGTEFGILTVTRLPEDALFEIAVSAKGGSFLYDGNEHSAGGLSSIYAGGEDDDEDGQLTVVINGHSYTVTGLRASRTETNAGTYKVNVTGTPVVTDAGGNDVTDQFVIRTEAAEMTIAKRQITLTSGTSSHAYNGKALTNDSVEVSGDGFAEGEGAAYDVRGSQTVVGTSSNEFSYTLNEGTNADNYDITTVFGQLNITGRDAKYLLTMTPESGTFLYDGSEKYVSGFVSTHVEIDGNRYSVSGLSASASGTAAGEYAVSVSGTPVVTDEAGNDVSDQFAVEFESASLQIRPRQIVFRSPDVSKEYDGEALTGEDIAIEGDGFVHGDGAVFSNHASRTITGVTQNTFDWAFTEGTDAGNYNVSTVYGFISITGRDLKYEIEMTANSDIVDYDGEEHAVDGFITNEFVIDNNEYTVSGIKASAAGTAPGVYGTGLSGDTVVLDKDGNDVSEEFAVTYISGTLTINDQPQGGVPSVAQGSTAGGDNGGDGGSGEPDGGGNGAGEADNAGGEENNGGASGDTASLNDPEIPYANAAPGYWALLNLVMVVISVILAIINVLRALRKKNDEEDKDTEGSADGEGSASKKSRVSAVIASAALAAVSAIVFFVTEDLSNTMGYVDKYTILMAVLLIGTLAAALLGRKRSDKSSDEKDS